MQVLRATLMKKESIFEDEKGSNKKQLHDMNDNKPYNSKNLTTNLEDSWSYKKKNWHSFLVSSVRSEPSHITTITFDIHFLNPQCIISFL